MVEHPTSIVRNSSEAPLQLPLDVEGRTSRMLLPSDTTVLPWAARHSQRVVALIRLGQLRVLSDAVAAAPEDETPEDEAPDVTVTEEKQMLQFEAESATGNGSAAPRKQARPKRVRKRRLSGGARRSLAKRAALAQTAEAAQAWANGNGHDVAAEVEAEPESMPDNVPPEPDVDLTAARLALADRVLRITERVLAIAEAR